MIDSHQHVWAASRQRYSWIPDGSPLDRDYTAEDARVARSGTSVDGVVLVQAADSYEDTDFMVAAAAHAPEIRGVVGWVPLDRPEEVSAVLARWEDRPVLKGIRCLSHDYPDQRWILKPEVRTSLALASERALTLDYVARSDVHLESIGRVASELPDLIVVLDHLGGPPLASGELTRWADHMRSLASLPNVNVKLSGLPSLSGEWWDANAWREPVDTVVGAFGASRVMVGSDWPVSTQQCSFAEVWSAQLDCLQGHSAEAVGLIGSGTAKRVYSLEAAHRANLPQKDHH